MTKEEGIQKYIDWVVPTPEFKTEYEKKLEEYYNEIFYGQS